MYVYNNVLHLTLVTSGPRTSMPHNPSPLINNPQPHGGYPGMPPGPGQWGTHHTPNQGYGTSPVPSGAPPTSMSHYSGMVNSLPSQSSSIRNNKQNKGQVRMSVPSLYVYEAYTARRVSFWGGRKANLPLYKILPSLLFYNCDINLYPTFFKIETLPLWQYL